MLAFNLSIEFYVQFLLCRLALERAKTAKLAVESIGDLVETHGQGGTCHDPTSNTPSGYDNSFLVVDGTEAWVVETCDRVWVAKQIKGDFLEFFLNLLEEVLCF